jgi:hypothetical protein
MITEISTYRLISELLIIEKKFNEGLIMTHDIYDSKDALTQELSKSFFNNIKIDKNKINIDLQDGLFTVNGYMKFLILINNLGYYICKMCVYNSLGSKNIKPETFKKTFLNDVYLKNITRYDFTLEPKFDITHKLKMNVLYHVTESKYIDKILKNGLIAKTKNTLSDYPERIYFVYNLNDANQYIKVKNAYYLRVINSTKPENRHKFPSIEYKILEITLPDNNDLIFYNDPNFTDKGIYTYDNINPKFIKILE